VDPGSNATGWGLIGGTSTRPELLESGVIRLRGTGLANRLAFLRREFEALVERVRPDSSAVESPFHGANARSALQLAHARGVILAGLAAAGIEVTEYTPATVKKSVTGNGRAAKPQVQAMVYKLLATAVGDRSSDRSDALAVALCHQASRSFSARCPAPDPVRPARRSRPGGPEVG
jgi:crossover junction endodeoxyribonuclease RuvC